MTARRATAALLLALAAATPISQAAASPEPPEPPERRERVVIHAVGDILLCDCFEGTFRRMGHDIAFTGMQGIFLRDALTIANLECAPADGGAIMSNKPNNLRCDTSALPVLAKYGIDVTVMANNHAGDFGFEKLVEGRRNLEALGLNPIGAGADQSEATQPAVFERGGWTIAVVAFSGVTGLTYTSAYPAGPALINPWFAEPDHPGVAPARFDLMREVVSALDQQVDIVLVSLHQGEYNETRIPTELERERAETLIEAGADAVIAHHHHRLLPFEYFQDRPIFWGMGNFVWSAQGPDRDVTAVAEIVVERDGSITARLIPAYLASDSHPVLEGSPDPSVVSRFCGSLPTRPADAAGTP
ncbi:MAG: CapA family protein [Acidimicrobiia bacterium]|nr:MAG: CapA family protein [Acidimicrobiia bacterium]